MTTYPVLHNATDAAQVAAFKAEVAITPTNWMGLTTDFLTMHANVPKFKETLKANGGDVDKLIAHINTYMVKDTCELAGFSGPKNATFALPASVSAFCASAG